MKKLLISLGLVLTGMASSVAAQTPGKQPNIIVIWGDDIGVHNISAYNHGIMGYQHTQH